MAAPTIKVEDCIGCGNCVDECPSDVLAMVEEHAAVAAPDACIECGICVDTCPVDAVSL